MNWFGGTRDRLCQSPSIEFQPFRQHCGMHPDAPVATTYNKAPISDRGGDRWGALAVIEIGVRFETAADDLALGPEVSAYDGATVVIGPGTRVFFRDGLEQPLSKSARLPREPQTRSDGLAVLPVNRWERHNASLATQSP